MRKASYLLKKYSIPIILFFLLSFALKTQAVFRHYFLVKQIDQESAELSINTDLYEQCHTTTCFLAKKLVSLFETELYAKRIDSALAPQTKRLLIAKYFSEQILYWEYLRNQQGQFEVNRVLGRDKHNEIKSFNLLDVDGEYIYGSTKKLGKNRYSASNVFGYGVTANYHLPPHARIELEIEFSPPLSDKAQSYFIMAEDDDGDCYRLSNERGMPLHDDTYYANLKDVNTFRIGSLRLSPYAKGDGLASFSLLDGKCGVTDFEVFSYEPEITERTIEVKRFELILND